MQKKTFIHIARTKRAKRAATTELSIHDKKFPAVAAQMEDQIEEYIRVVANRRRKNNQQNDDAGGEEVGGGAEFLLDRHWRRSRRRSRLRRQLPISGPVVGVLAPFAFVPQVNSLQLFTVSASDVGDDVFFLFNFSFLFFIFYSQRRIN